MALRTCGRRSWAVLPRRCLATQAGLDASRLVVRRTEEPQAKPAKEEIAFGKQFTDHMLEIDWTKSDGWHAPVISAYHDLPISPAASSLHYALQCFEGMKGYKDADGSIRMFRPDRNMARLNSSMARLYMPALDGEEFTALLGELLKVDEAWIPQGDGYSVYLRPTAISTHPFLGVGEALSVKLYCIMSPAGPYYASGFRGIKLFADCENVRAWPGGVGNAKLGGNYGPTIAPQMRASADQGCAQVLWLFGDEHLCTEVGTSNVFFVMKNPSSGRLELITPPLDRGDILPGVTRRSILELARGEAGLPGYEDVDVVERDVPMAEVVTAAEEGRLREAFGAGTAAVVTPVSGIRYLGKDIAFPGGEDAGPVTQRIFEDIMAIQYGRVEHPWSHRVL